MDSPLGTVKKVEGRATDSETGKVYYLGVLQGGNTFERALSRMLVRRWNKLKAKQTAALAAADAAR